MNQDACFVNLSLPSVRNDNRFCHREGRSPVAVYA